MTCCTIANIISRIDFAAFATVLTAIFTGCLVICNIYLWCSTNKAANAAKQAAEALPKIERAYIFVTLNEHIRERGWGENNIDNKSFYTDITLFNHGKTPAILSKIFTCVIVTKDNPTKAGIENILEERTLNLKSRVDPNKQIDQRVIQASDNPFSAIFLGTVTKKEFLEFSNVNKKADPPHMFCCGKIIYNDIMKQSHNTWFCWRYIPSIGNILIADNDELNDYD